MFKVKSKSNSGGNKKKLYLSVKEAAAFIGYPIWWYSASWVVYNFIKDNDFTVKIVIPFSTSAASVEVGSEAIQEMTATGDWQEGSGFRSSVSERDVSDWVKGLE